MSELEANELADSLIINVYRNEGDDKHLRECPDLRVVPGTVQGANGTYGCDTGCEYATLDACVDCPHGKHDSFTYGQFGELADMIEQMKGEAERRGWRE